MITERASRKIQGEINTRLDEIEKRLNSRKYKDKQDFLKGGYLELQDFKEWIVEQLKEDKQ